MAVETIITNPAVAPSAMTVELIDTEPIPPAPPPPPPGFWSIFPHACAPVYDVPTISTEARQALHASIGASSVGMLLSAVEWAQNELTGLERGLTTMHAFSVPETAGRIKRLAEYREAARAELVEALQAFPDEQVDVPPASSVSRQLPHWRAGVDYRPDMIAKRDKHQAELAAVNAEIETIKAACQGPGFLSQVNPPGNALADVYHDVVALITEKLRNVGHNANTIAAVLGNVHHFADGRGGSPYPEMGAFHLAGERLTKLLHRRSELTAQIIDLEETVSEATALVATAVASAIKNFGGRATIVTGLFAALARGVRTEVEHLEALVKSLDADLEGRVSLGLGDDPGTAALQAQRSQAHDDWTAARSARVLSHRQRADDIVAAALAGEEQARAELEGIAAKHAKEFAGLAADLAAARLDKIVATMLTEK